MSLASNLATTLFHLTRGSRLRQLLNYPSEPVSVLDPCAGIGAAIRQLTDDANTNRYAVELDAERARLAEESGIETIHANTFDVHAKVESFSLLYLNPPYDSEVSSFDNKRMELLFLRRTLRWLVNGGILLMVRVKSEVGEYRERLIDFLIAQGTLARMASRSPCSSWAGTNPVHPLLVAERRSSPRLRRSQQGRSPQCACKSRLPLPPRRDQGWQL